VGRELADGEVEGIQAFLNRRIEADLDSLRFVERLANLDLERGMVSGCRQPLGLIPSEFRHEGVERILPLEEKI
jgi:hypothetical protein